MTHLAGRGIITLGAALLCLALPMRHSSAEAFTYDFDDNSVNPLLWSIRLEGFGPQLEEVNNRLEITLPSTSTEDPISRWFMVGLHSEFLLRGDFDVQIEYYLLDWPDSNGVRVGFGIVRDGQTGRYQGDGIVERVSLGPAAWDIPGQANREIYLAHFLDDDVLGWIPTEDQSGKLRLVRSNTTLTCYYFGGSDWVTVASDATTTEDVLVSINAWSHDYAFRDQDVKIAFDNFVVTQGEVVMGRMVPSLSGWATGAATAMLVAAVVLAIHLRRHVT